MEAILSILNSNFIGIVATGFGVYLYQTHNKRIHQQRIERITKLLHPLHMKFKDLEVLFNAVSTSSGNYTVEEVVDSLPQECQTLKEILFDYLYLMNDHTFHQAAYEFIEWIYRYSGIQEKEDRWQELMTNRLKDDALYKFKGIVKDYYLKEISKL